MKTFQCIALALALAATGATAAQLYRWVDEKGNVEWRDTPPPANAKNVEKRNVGANTIDTSSVPYSVQQAMKNNPVTLWNFECGAPCTSAREHLGRRGVPHTERNSAKEPEAMKKATGSLDVPVLFVGAKQLRGYEQNAWDAALDEAGYPKTAPPGMKPKPATTAKAADEKAAEPAAKSAEPSAKAAEPARKTPTPQKAY